MTHPTPQTNEAPQPAMPRRLLILSSKTDWTDHAYHNLDSGRKT